MSPLLASPSPPRPRLPHKFFAWFLVAAVFVTSAAFVARSLLIRQMRLPRLTVDQGSNVIAVAIAPDGKTIFAGSDPTRDALRTSRNRSADVFVYQAASGRLIRRLHGFYWRSNAVAPSPDGQTVLASGYAHSDDPGPKTFQASQVFAWNWRSGQRLWGIAGDMPLSYSPEGRFIGMGDGIHTASDGRLVFGIPRGLSSDSQIAFSPDGKLFGFIGSGTLNKKGFVDSDDGDRVYNSTSRLHLWHTDTGKEAKDFPFTRVRAFDMARNGQWLVIAADWGGMGGGTDGSVVRRVDITTGAVSWTRERSYNAPLHDPDAALNSVVISPNGKYVITQSPSSQLIVLDADTGRELFRPFAHQDSGEPAWGLPGGLAFSADGRTLVSRCGSRVLFWDASSLR